MQLKAGDVLMYKRGGPNGTFMGKVIQLITGSKYTHCSVIVPGPSGTLYVVEQDGRGYLLPVADYLLFKNDTKPALIEVWRPKFTIFSGAFTYFQSKKLADLPYGYRCLLDAAINHLLGRVVPKYRYRPFLTKAPYVLVHCSGLIGKLFTQAFSGNPPRKFYKYTLLEPDDFVTEDFEYIGLGTDIWQQ